MLNIEIEQQVKNVFKTTEDNFKLFFSDFYTTILITLLEAYADLYYTNFVNHMEINGDLAFFTNCKNRF